MPAYLGRQRSACIITRLDRASYTYQHMPGGRDSQTCHTRLGLLRAARLCAQGGTPGEPQRTAGFHGRSTHVRGCAGRGRAGAVGGRGRAGRGRAAAGHARAAGRRGRPGALPRERPAARLRRVCRRGAAHGRLVRAPPLLVPAGARRGPAAPRRLGYGARAPGAGRPLRPPAPAPCWALGAACPARRCGLLLSLQGKSGQADPTLSLCARRWTWPT